MKNWIRIFLVCFVLIGGTAFFVYQLSNQFNNALDNLSASSFAIAKIPPIHFFDKTNKEQIPTSTPETISIPAVSTDPISTSTPETISTSTTPTDLKLSFIFPKKNNEVYIGCVYQLFFQSSTAVYPLETVLLDAGTREAVEPIASGLARENKIEPNSQNLDWKVGEVWPGEYYIKVSNVNGVDLESKVFTIRKMPKGISVDERERNCKESDGSSFYLLDKS